MTDRRINPKDAEEQLQGRIQAITEDYLDGRITETVMEASFHGILSGEAKASVIRLAKLGKMARQQYRKDQAFKFPTGPTVQ